MGAGAAPFPDAEMTVLDPKSLPLDKSYYAFFISAVVPRPIAFVSTQSEDGIFNLAPYSFFGLMCHDPPTLAFCGISRPSGPKDTVANLRATGECVIHIISEHFVEAANVCCGEYPPDVDEFELSGLRKAPSALPLRTPVVADALVQYECRLAECKELTKRDGTVGGTIVLCTVERINVHPSVLRHTPNGSPYVDLESLKPISRLGANDYGRTGGVFEIPRPPGTVKSLRPDVSR